MIPFKKPTFIDGLHSKFSFSSEDGEYGIKLLSGRNPEVIHIFVNRFTNDGGEDNYSDWIKESNDILDADDMLYGYNWASGKKLFKHTTTIVERLLAAKGNVLLIIVILATSVAFEWKQARSNIDSK